MILTIHIAKINQHVSTLTGKLDALLIILKSNSPKSVDLTTKHDAIWQTQQVSDNFFSIQSLFSQLFFAIHCNVNMNVMQTRKFVEEELKHLQQVCFTRQPQLLSSTNGCHCDFQYLFQKLLAHHLIPHHYTTPSLVCAI